MDRFPKIVHPTNNSPFGIYIDYFCKKSIMGISQKKLGEQELRMIEKGLAQLENGEFHTHEEIRQKIKASLPRIS